MLHFSDNETIAKGDRLGKMRPLVDLLQVKYQELYCLGKSVVIDETLVSWRDRLISMNIPGH